MHTYSYTKILKFYKFRTFGVFYENSPYILLLKNFNIKIQYQKFKEYIRSSRLPNMTSNRNGLLIMAYFRSHSWSFVVTRGHSWSFVVTRGHSWSFVVTRGHSCVLLDKTFANNFFMDIGIALYHPFTEFIW